MCRRYKELNVPEVSTVEVRALEMQGLKCETAIRTNKCEKDCENCILDESHFDTFLEVYERQMADIL